ncbi:MAG: hypothetical protein JST40_08540 [Armatimonadetes bacterium]|nr:hypothetical protein [Armatimonadota bacterium]
MIESISRWMWASTLWLVRRPVMRRMRQKSIQMLPQRMRAQARENILKQDRLARRIGLPLMRILTVCLLGSIAVTVAYEVVLNWVATSVESASR